VTDSAAIFPEDPRDRPPYLTAIFDKTFYSKITRVTGDSGQALPGLSGRHWGSHARHHYSKDEPWNSTQTMLMLDNTTGSDNIHKVVLDGTTYSVLVPQPCITWSFEQDSRWQPSTNWPNVRIGVSYDKSRDSDFNPLIPVHDSLYWADVNNQCALVRAWRLPIRPHLIGQGEGNASFDGRWIAISTNHRRFSATNTMPDTIVIVDMDPPPPNDYASGARRVGPPFEIPDCGGVSAHCAIGNISVSASGHYVDVKYAEGTEFHRIFAVDPTTLSLSPVTMDAGSYRCYDPGDVTGNTSGWIVPLKHADMTLDPDDNMADIIVGGVSCSVLNTDSTGKVAKVRLSDGHVTFLSSPGTGGMRREEFFRHLSARSQDRLGWVYLNYDTLDAMSTSPRRFSNEVVAYATDGSRRMQRFGYMHAFEYTQSSIPPENTDDDEAQPVPSRDGKRIVFASNWTLKTITPLSQKQYNSYVLDAADCATVDVPRPQNDATLALARALPNPTRGPLVFEVGLPDSRPARLIVLDIAGRVTCRQDIESPAAGRRTVTIRPKTALRPGFYFVVLQHPSGTRRQAVVVLR